MMLLKRVTWMMMMERKTPYLLSKDYGQLYQMLCAGLTVVGFVDSDTSEPQRQVRDVCMIRRDAAWTISVWGRGCSYIAIYPWMADGFANPSQLDEAGMFAADCQRAQLSFVAGLDPAYQ